MTPLAELWVPRPAPWLTQNGREHWSEKADNVRQWKAMTIIQARQQGFPKGLAPADIDVVMWFASTRRRDPGNFTPTTKAIIDALCTGPKPPHGWGAWADDDPRHLTERMPILEVDPLRPEGVRLTAWARQWP